MTISQHRLTWICILEGHTDQDVLLDAVKLNLTTDEYKIHLHHMRDVARTRGVDSIIKEYGVDVIIGPADSLLTSIASGSGENWPICTWFTTFLGSLF